MSCTVVSIMAQANQPDGFFPDPALNDLPPGADERHAISDAAAPKATKSFPPKSLPVHNFPGPQSSTGSRVEPWSRREDPLDRNPDLWMYRKRTVILLRRYLRYSLETGRLPSIMGSEFFRTRVTSYGVSTFEDRVILVHDVERCLQRIDEFSQQMISRIVLQEYEQEQVAAEMGCTRKTVQRQLTEALDAMSEIFLETGLLQPLPSPGKKSCQGGKNDDFPGSSCNEGK